MDLTPKSDKNQNLTIKNSSLYKLELTVALPINLYFQCLIDFRYIVRLVGREYGKGDKVLKLHRKVQPTRSV